MAKTKELQICKCPEHGHWAVTVGDSDGGTRLTPTKCCGRWTIVKAFPMTPGALRSVAEDIVAESNRT